MFHPSLAFSRRCYLHNWHKVMMMIIILCSTIAYSPLFNVVRLTFAWSKTHLLHNQHLIKAIMLNSKMRAIIPICSLPCKNQSDAVKLIIFRDIMKSRYQQSRAAKLSCPTPPTPSKSINPIVPRYYSPSWIQAECTRGVAKAAIPRPVRCGSATDTYLLNTGDAIDAGSD